MTNYEKMIALVASPATPKDIVDWAYINRICLVDLPSEPEFACMEASVDKFFETHNPFNDAQGEEQVWREFLSCQYVEAVSHVDKRTVYIPEVIHTLVQSPNLHTCACTHGKCDHSLMAECQKYVLVDPVELAELEDEASIGRAVVDCQKQEYQDAMKSLEHIIERAKTGSSHA